MQGCNLLAKIVDFVLVDNVRDHGNSSLVLAAVRVLLSPCRIVEDSEVVRRNALEFPLHSSGAVVLRIVADDVHSDRTILSRIRQGARLVVVESWGASDHYVRL